MDGFDNFLFDPAMLAYAGTMSPDEPPPNLLNAIGKGAYSEKANEGIPKEYRALLRTIAGSESAYPGRDPYRVMYGGKQVDDFSDHPRLYHNIVSGPNRGLKTSAAGGYQFLGRSWDEAQRALGLQDFSPESQDKAAIWHAENTYRSKTGRSLQSDIAAAGTDPDKLNSVGRALSGWWTSLPGGIEPNPATRSFSQRFASELSADPASGPALYGPNSPKIDVASALPKNAAPTIGSDNMARPVDAGNGTKKMGLFDQLLGQPANQSGQQGQGLLGALGDPQMLASLAMIAKGISPNSQLQPQEMMQTALALKQRQAESAQRQAEIAQRQAEANRQAGFEERRVSLAEKTAGITPTARDLMSMGLQPGTQEYKDTYEKMVGLQKKGWQPVSVKTPQGEQTFFTDGNQFKRPDELIQGFSQQPGVGGPYKDIAELRKEYIAQPNVRSYQQAITPYQSMVKSADVDTATADIDLISGLAKVLDPDSVVREGEYATVQKSNSLSEQLKGKIQYVFEGKGKLTSESRKQLMAIARNRVDSYREGAQSQVERYRGLAKKFNFDPSAVVEDTPETPTWPKSQGKPYSGNLPPPPPGFVVQ